MADIQGTNVAAAVAPFSTADKFPTHYAKYGHGGWRSVDTYDDLASISSERKEEGMAVYVIDEQCLYVLVSGVFQKLVYTPNVLSLNLPFLTDASFVSGSEIETATVESAEMFGCSLDDLRTLSESGVSLVSMFRTTDSETGNIKTVSAVVKKSEFVNLDKLTLVFDCEDPLDSNTEKRYTVVFTWAGVGTEVAGREEGSLTKYDKCKVEVTKVVRDVVTRITEIETILESLGTAEEATQMFQTVNQLNDSITVNPTTNVIESLVLADENNKVYTLKVGQSTAGGTLILESQSAE